MGIAFSIVAIIILVVSVLLIRRSRATTKKRPPGPDRVSKVQQPYARFHSVSLENLSGACAAAYAMEGERFLAGAAPRIPLPECDVPVCNCIFAHHTDRRMGSNRRQNWTGSVGNTGGITKEQRHEGDRRSNDPDNIFA